MCNQSQYHISTANDGIPLPKILLDMSRPGKNIRVWDKSTNPGFAEGKEVSVMRGCCIAAI